MFYRKLLQANETVPDNVAASGRVYLLGLILICLLVYLVNIILIDSQFQLYYWLRRYGFEEYGTDFVTSTLRLSLYNILRIGVVLFCLKVYRLSLFEIGWQKDVDWKKLSLSVLLVPLYLMLVGSIVAVFKYGLVPAYTVKFSETWGNLNNPVVWFYSVMVVIVSPLEELFYRGFIQTAFEKKMGSKYAIFLTSACYALMHGRVSGNLSQHFLSGLFFGFIKKWDRSLWSCSAAHLIMNLLVVWFSITYH